MIAVSVLYPRNDDSTFDIDYYVNKHMPMVGERLGDSLRGMQIHEGLGGPAPGTPPTYAAGVHLLFDSVEAFQGAFAPHAGEIMADIPNYTNVAPVIQVSAVR